MSLRIGYVNVRGLNRPTWEACHRMLDTSFDYLFLAETWFVDHEEYTRHRRFIASTPKPRRNLHGRSRGGIYLLGSGEARSKVRKVQVTEHTITFSSGRQVVSGVYFPPNTLENARVIAYLDSLRSSTAILGDINACFRDTQIQHGAPGPVDRLEAFTDFLARSDHEHLLPEPGGGKLTTDHAFAHAGQISRLSLLDNTIREIQTDHRYTLSLTLGHGEPKRGSTLPMTRFRIGQLAKPEKQEALRAWIRKADRPFQDVDGVDAMNRKLVRCCQQAQEKTIGVARPSPGRSEHAQKPSTREQTIQGSIRLYKHASQTSQENDVIFPTEAARSQGMDAMTENLAIFQERWKGTPWETQVEEGDPLPGMERTWTREQVIQEIRQQEAEKSCGADGIHIRFLKVVQDTPVITWLWQLYTRCRREGRTPQAWNESEIYLLTKDVDKRRDAKNLRPIAIISIFRKVFERLLLLEIQDQPWARLHWAQAGFRPSYSTYSNAAVVHALLSSGSRTTVLFLDFKSAFDVVDYQRLDAKLTARGCPPTVRCLIRDLNFRNVKSRILINGQVSDWFPRTRGVLQGSPISPWLFNIFVDDLLHRANPPNPRIPDCLFYADDGALVPRTMEDLVRLLEIVEGWTKENQLWLNPAKCAVVSAEEDLPTLLVYGQEISRVKTYPYLGFPVTPEGIDFQAHLSHRIQAAIGRAAYLGLQSNAWGPAHRLRVYKQFLAPMFEYGAPLVWAWAQQNRAVFNETIREIKPLMAWIANSSESRAKVTMNLCGLSSLPKRFQRLSTAYQLIVEEMNPQSPLPQLLAQARPDSFAGFLGNDRAYARFVRTGDSMPTRRKALGRFLKAELYQTVVRESHRAHLTSLIPIESRKVPGLFLADISLSALGSVQRRLLQYRKGVFMHNSICSCDPKVKFIRGHEHCKALHHLVRLTRFEKTRKRQMKVDLGVGKEKLTNLDFLINDGQVKRAGKMLSRIQKHLGMVYKEEKRREEAGKKCTIIDER